MSSVVLLRLILVCITLCIADIWRWLFGSVRTVQVRCVAGFALRDRLWWLVSVIREDAFSLMAIFLMLCVLPFDVLAAYKVARPDSDFGVCATRSGVFRVLMNDRISMKTNVLSGGVGQVKNYSSVSVRVISCWHGCDHDADAQDTALIEVRDLRRGERLFFGWIFSKDVGVSLFEHHRYDLALIGCD